MTNKYIKSLKDVYFKHKQEGCGKAMLLLHLMAELINPGESENERAQLIEYLTNKVGLLIACFEIEHHHEQHHN